MVIVKGNVTARHVFTDAPLELNITPPTGVPTLSVTDWITIPGYSTERSNQARITRCTPSG